MNAIRTILAMIILATLGGCSREPETKPVVVKPATPDPRPEVVEPVYRIATELRAGQDVGMNRQRFNELLQKFATELSLSKDKAESPREKQILSGYSEVMQIYKDSAAIWDVKISIPELTDLANRSAKLGDFDLIVQNSAFQRAVIEGIPLNFYPNESTGIDAIVSEYQLPVKDSKGWRTIPNDSVQRVWSRARLKTEEVIKMQKG